ncbi:metallophosphoesterase [Elongatibacter sediminis]
MTRLPVHKLMVGLLAWTSLVSADPAQVDDFHWTGVERIIAIGDLHGDYENYLATLRAAGLINRRDRWSGGATHLVQTGDIPDRGPDTQRIMEHLDGLVRAARRKGGAVHRLIGNHEAMNVYGDLRYVSPGEYEAFVDRNSSKLRDRYFEVVMRDLQQRDPEAFANLPENYRVQWDQEHPLGWVEHRQAWDPRWNPEGEFAKRALGLKVAVQINDLLFVHGGISHRYCRNSLASLTEEVVGHLREFNPADTGPLEDEFGPLWYRGLSGHPPEATEEVVQAILDHHGARHIVVGHTPTSGVIWPRYDARVIQIDTGIAAAYGGYVAYLEVTPEGLFAGYPGGRVPLPGTDDERIAYLQKVIALAPDNPHLQQRLARLQAPAVESGADGESVPDAESAATETSAAAVGAPASVTESEQPTCGIYE